jgi:hypothetical protein
MKTLATLAMIVLVALGVACSRLWPTVILGRASVSPPVQFLAELASVALSTLPVCVGVLTFYVVVFWSKRRRGRRDGRNAPS